MKDIKYIIYKEEDKYVSQCLNVDVASFGDTVDEAIDNIAEAVELYFEDNDSANFVNVDMAMIGDRQLNI